MNSLLFFVGAIMFTVVAVFGTRSLASLNDCIFENLRKMRLPRRVRSFEVKPIAGNFARAH